MTKRIILALLLAVVGIGGSYYFASMEPPQQAQGDVYDVPGIPPDLVLSAPLLGDSSQVVGQLTRPVKAWVLLYPTAGPPVLSEVTVIPGTWLVPEQVFPQPKGQQ